MPRRDPTLIIRLGTTRDSRSIRAHNTDLIRGIDFLISLCGCAGPRSVFALLLLRGEERGDPGVVDEEAGSAEEGEEEEVEE